MHLRLVAKCRVSNKRQYHLFCRPASGGRTPHQRGRLNDSGRATAATVKRGHVGSREATNFIGNCCWHLGNSEPPIFVQVRTFGARCFGIQIFKTTLNDRQLATKLRSQSMTAAQDSREPSPSHAKTEKDRPGAEDNGKVEENISEPTYPTGGRLVIICLALCLTVFISALSNTIVATAVPTITAAFHSYDDIGWYTSGELITVSLRRNCKFHTGRDVTDF